MKRYIITESQLEKIVNNRVRPINENAEAEEVLIAFDRFIDEKGLCTIGEDIISEDIITDLSNTLKKGVLIASAIVALGLMTPQEAQAQTGSKPKKEFVNIFKKRQKAKCTNPNKSHQGSYKSGDKTKDTPNRQLPTKYFVKKIKPKFDTGNDYSVHAFMLKGGKIKKLSEKNYENMKDEVDFQDMPNHVWEKIKSNLNK